MICFVASVKKVLLGLLILCSHLSFAATSVLIWPIDPVLEEQENATAIWLENQNTEAVYFQIRVLEWQQENYADVYNEQQDVAISPPFTLIEPGKRQMIRLVRKAPVAAGKEKAYRILIDEIPRVMEKGSDGSTKPAAKLGVDLQMRYSVPLFSSGNGVWTKQNYEKPRDMALSTQPVLNYKIVQSNGKKWLEIKNNGNAHARITRLNAITSGKTIKLAEGLFGYVLANSTMRWPVPANMPSNAHLEAMVNHNDKPTLITR